MPKEKEIGVVEGYYTHIGVGIIKLKVPLKKGQKIHIKGNTTDFTQTASSMQINKKNIEQAKKGDEIGLKVKDRVRPNDKVYLVE